MGKLVYQKNSQKELIKGELIYEDCQSKKL